MRYVVDWLESHWSAPAYSGWVLVGLIIFFFGAATNTMAGWLYVMSGVMLALLVVAALLPPRMVRSLSVERQPIRPIMAGETMTVRLRIQNASSSSRDLIQIRDVLPTVLATETNHPLSFEQGTVSPPLEQAKPGQSRIASSLAPSSLASSIERQTVERQTVQERAIAPIESIKPHVMYAWTYQCPVAKRGVYRWHTVQLRTAAPLGLFWCRRDYEVPAKAIVYPLILNLDRCSLLDVLGRETHAQNLSQQQAHQANEGLTRALRPYRWGDPTRLIHWRTSARYGELRVRELEVLTSSPAVAIAIDTAIDWNAVYFEQAAIAAISLYDYARRRQMNVSLWTAEHGTVHTPHAAYEVLADMRPNQGALSVMPPAQSVVWLTQSSSRLDHLPEDSRWVCWPTAASAASQPANSSDTSSHTPSIPSVASTIATARQGISIDPHQELRLQLMA